MCIKKSRDADITHISVSLTLTYESISRKPWSAGTGEAAYCVIADGSTVAVVQTLSTLINVCRVRLQLIYTQTHNMYVAHKVSKCF